MEFESIEHVRKFFGIKEEDEKEIVKEIKKRIAKVHNDKSNGEYESETQKREHEELTEALNFLKGQNNQVTISKNDWVELKQKVNELELQRRANGEQSSLLVNLRDTVVSSGVNFQKKHFSFKITSLVLGSMISAIWLFPNMVEKNPMLNQIVIENYNIYTGIWLYLIAMLGVTWVFVRRIEVKDKELRKRYLIEAFQFQMFKLFLAWLRTGFYDRFEYDEDYSTGTYRFTKDEFFNFILNHFSPMYSRFSNDLSGDIYDIYNKVRDRFERKELVELSARPRTLINKFFGTPGDIDVDLAQELTDTILTKLLSRGVVVKVEDNSFTEAYTFRGR